MPKRPEDLVGSCTLTAVPSAQAVAKHGIPAGMIPCWPEDMATRWSERLTWVVLPIPTVGSSRAEVRGPGLDLGARPGEHTHEQTPYSECA